MWITWNTSQLIHHFNIKKRGINTTNMATGQLLKKMVPPFLPGTQLDTLSKISLVGHVTEFCPKEHRQKRSAPLPGLTREHFPRRLFLLSLCAPSTKRALWTERKAEPQEEGAGVAEWLGEKLSTDHKHPHGTLYEREINLEIVTTSLGPSLRAKRKSSINISCHYIRK